MAGTLELDRDTDPSPRGRGLRRRCGRAADEPPQGRLPDRRCSLSRGRLLRGHHAAHPNLVGFLARVARRLGGTGESIALFHLDQGMGGGKSHALVGLYHMAE